MIFARGQILGEALDGLGRWYVAVPPMLVVGFLVALFLATGGGQTRLERASARLQTTALRAHAVDDVDDALLLAQGSLRGYLLTEEPRFLEQYRRAAVQVGDRLDSLRRAYAGSSPAGGAAQAPQVDALGDLVARRLRDYERMLALHDHLGTSRASDYVKSEDVLQTSRAIGDALAALRQRETRERTLAVAHWESSLRLSRWFTIAGTVLNLVLIGITSRLVYVDLERRSRQTAELRDEKQQLERQVEARTRQLVDLSTHLQSVAEREKASLARELHDELGGLLVGARMDLSWAERHLDGSPAGVRERLARVQASLAAGVDLKRRIIEELRPTLLDNVGLFAALRWQMKESCGRAGLRCDVYFPAEEPRFTATAAIALFRIAQESFTNVIKHAAATRVELGLDLDQDVVVLRIADDGIGVDPERFEAIGSHGLASMRHRARALGGRLEVRGARGAGTVLVARVPAANALQA